MQRTLSLFFLIFISLTVTGQIKRLDTEHFQVKFETETEKYVLASLKVLELTRTLTINSGFFIPSKIKFSVTRTDRNVLYFDKNSLNGIIWEYNDLANFLPPNESKKKNIYGLCHELGHLCMYNTTNNKNDWMSYDYRESWADFFANFMIDSIYQYLGTDFWPEPHNYLETAGLDFMLNRIKENKPELLSFNKSSLYWCELNNKIGFENINDFFEEIEKQKVKNPDAREKYLNVLVSYINDPEIQKWFNDYSQYIILNKN